ncbi:MAG: hypothetical protein WAW23_10610, partial [Candidatus Methanoperedens sp.]
GFSAWFLYAVWLLLKHIFKEMEIEDPSCIKSISRLPKYVWYGTTNRRALEIMRLDISRELFRDDILLIVNALGDRYVESILDNPDEVNSSGFQRRLSRLEGLKMEDDEFIRIFYKIINK